jgi:hypothetical protein
LASLFSQYNPAFSEEFIKLALKHHDIKKFVATLLQPVIYKVEKD